MTNLILPLANWNMGTAIIIFFAALCVGMTIMVISFVNSGKKEKKDEINAIAQKENSKKDI